jgi:hypothetical protein
MKTVNTHEAKTHFSRLLKRVALGEQIDRMLVAQASCERLVLLTAGKN